MDILKEALESLQIITNSFETGIWIFYFQFLVGSDCCNFFGNKILALDPTWSNINLSYYFGGAAIRKKCV